jgi:hypothetical protein
MVKLTRDTTNNPLWNTAAWASERSLEEEDGSTGRMGRFSRKFGGVTMPKEMSQPAASAESKGKEEGVKPPEAKKDVEESVKEDMVDLTGMGMGMGKSSVGMGGVLDDVSWFEQMADLTGGEAKAPGKGKKKKP